MNVVAFLPAKSTNFILQSFAPSELVLAHNWIALDSHLRKPGTKLMVFDPAAEGVLNLKAACKILDRHRAIPSIAYLEPRPENLKIVLHLSRHGLTDALPAVSDGEAELAQTIRLQLGRQAALQILSAFEPAIGNCAWQLVNALGDMLEQPQTYHSVADLCRASRLSEKQLFEAFHRARLGTPKKFLALTKVAWGYGYLKHTHLSVESVSSRLGYKTRSLFAANARAIIGLSPSSLREQQNDPQDIVMEAVEWLCKPRCLGSNDQPT